MLAGVAFGFLQVTPCATRTPSCSWWHLKSHGGMLAFTHAACALMTAVGRLMVVQGMSVHEAHTHIHVPPAASVSPPVEN